MFKQTDKDAQFYIFGSVSGVLVGESLKEYNNENGWYNQFCKQAITSGQSRALKVNGGSVRTDSKLISSNIAFCSRYEIIHRTLLKFLKSVDTALFKKLSGDERPLRGMCRS